MAPRFSARAVFEKSFSAPGCGDARFASLRAFREYGDEIRAQQVAIVNARAMLAAGASVELVRRSLRAALECYGMSDDAIEDHVADPQRNVGGLFIVARDLVA